MRHWKNCLAALALFASAAFIAPGVVNADWNGDRWIKSNGEYARNEWVNTGGSYYNWFGDDGRKRAENGVFTVGNDIYCLEGVSNYRMENKLYTGWGGKTYYFGGNGKAVRNVRKTVYGDSYYFKSNAEAARNQWIKIDGKEYWFDGDCEMADDGREKTNRGYFYFKDDGTFARDYWAYYNREYYKKNGRWAHHEFVKFPEGTFYFNPDGEKEYGRVRWYHNDYYVDEDTGMVRNQAIAFSYYSGGRYVAFQRYYKADGKMAKNETVNGRNTKIRFDKDGDVVKVSGKGAYWKGRKFYNGLYYMKSSWLNYNGKRYYMQDNGTCILGYQKFNDAHYMFDYRTGEMKKGLVGSGDKAQFFDLKTGRQKLGWVRQGKNTYYMTTGFWRDEGMYRSGIYKINNRDRMFADSGKLLTGWNWVKGKKYFSDYKTGVLKSGWMTLKGKRYHFDSNTHQAAQGIKKIGSKRYLFNSQGELQYGFFKYKGKRYYSNRKSGVLWTKTGRVKIEGKYYRVNKDYSIR